MFRLPKSFFNHAFVQVLITGLFLIFLIYFIRNEHLDFVRIKATLAGATFSWIVWGLLVSVLYLLLQATLYVYAFKSIGITVAFGIALRLYLKRNFISTFLPAGTFTSLAFFTNELDSYKLQKVQVHYGSFLFVLASLISMVLIAIPAIAVLSINHQLRSADLISILFLVMLIGACVYAGYCLVLQKGIVFRLAKKFSPEFVSQIHEVGNQNFSLPTFIKTCLISLIIELVGVAHLYIALAALGFQPTWEVSLIGYTIMIIILSISPFLKGMGAIEVSVSYVLTLYGYAPLGAASVTLLFRLFEFWIPFVISGSVFLIRKDNLLLRLFPSVFIFILGIVNVVSALTPAIPERLRLLTDFIPFEVTEFSNAAILLIGVFMIVSSAFLLTGAKNAWRVAMLISFLSLTGHLTKAFDYEEALLALTTMGILGYTHKAYFVRYDTSFHLLMIQKISILIISLLVYSVVGFYLLHTHHFEMEFSWLQSFKASVKTMAFISEGLAPKTRTGNFFLYSIQIGATIIVAYTMYLLYRHYRPAVTDKKEDRRVALTLLQRYGNSSMDYFKIYPDKQFFFSESRDAFLAYGESKHYALVLENPVALNAAARQSLLEEFEIYCSQNGLRTFYYRVTEEDLPLYRSLQKKSILLGQEGILELSDFTMEGSARKPLRNATNKIENGGYILKINEPPLSEVLLTKLKTVSDSWLDQKEHAESGFSQGVFDSTELKNCIVLTVADKNENVVAFLNCIPSYKPGEITYDLIRQHANSPNGILDYLMVKLIEYAKANHFKTLNLGMAPLAGLEGSTVSEQILKFYADHFKQASRLKGLFAYKDKFDPRWENRYLIYDETFDLVRFPAALRRVSVEFDD